jgi:D-alanyl-D-alanine carboxypeptidase
MPSFGRALLRRLAVLVTAGSALFAFNSAAGAANNNYAAIVVDANTGQILFSRNADAARYPASLTKMMTLYLVFEDLERGKISLRSRLTVSANAANQAPSRLGLRAGSTIRVEDAILALVTKSANDVAMAVAENLSASAEAFAQRMTSTARSIGMNSTTFRNPHGLPDAGQISTARDLALLGRALQDRFPQYYSYFSTVAFAWDGVTYRNHNNLLGTVDGVNGIKTGYTSASGYNLVTSLQRDGRYVVAVVMGGNSSASRDEHMRELIATYLPRASAGPRTAALVVTSPLDLLPVPLPRLNPNRTDGIATAAIPPAAPALAPVVPVAEGDFDPFVIQIGAYPSEQAAVMQLERAQQLEGQMLAGAAPYTETVDVGGVLHFRARFIGFATADAAWAACSAFEGRGIDCFVPQ